MTDIHPDRRDAAVDRVQLGLRGSEDISESAITVAQQLQSVELISDDNVRFAEGEDLNLDEFDPAIDHLRRTRKVAEVMEDELHIDVGHGKFARMATATGQLSSITSITLAANNLIRSSRDLAEEYNRAGTPEEVEEETYEEFFRSSSIFVIECFLFTTPVNYQIAWRGTRYVNNHYLYHLRELNTSLYRITLSEVHYLIRGIVPSALQSSTDRLAEYLVWTGRSTLEILADQEELDSSNILSEARDVVDGFLDLAQEQYDVSAEVANEVEPWTIVYEILDEIRGNVDFTIPDTDDLPDPHEMPGWDDISDTDDLPDVDDLPDWDDLSEWDEWW